MPRDPFETLAQHLDDLPGGFPPTESGVELRILRRLFSAEQARLAVHLTLIPEPPAVIAKRAKLPPDDCLAMLLEMERRGLIFSLGKGSRIRYMAAQFVVGIWEYNVEDLDEGLIRDMNEYIPALMDEKAWKKAPQLRTIPIEKSLRPHHEALPYEHAEHLVRGRKKYLVAPCICRREHALRGAGCDKPEEACLVFDFAAEYYARRGVGRVIDEAETLEILRRAQDQGLVVQPSNSQKAVNICLCCGCCCQVLKVLKRRERPADLFASAFVAHAAPDRCNGCGACLKRCQMEAVALVDGRVTLDDGRCIGCGLCVPTCPTGALALARTPDRPHVPASFQQSLINLGKARGRMSNASLGWMVLKSKLDRLRAGRG